MTAVEGFEVANPEVGITSALPTIRHHRVARLKLAMSSLKQGFPANFTIQKIRNASANSIAHLSAQQIAAFFRDNPSVANQLLTESCDKRYSPSTFIAGEGDEYSVGWYSNGYECEKRFPTLADAATDYLLFSLGRERWSPPES